MKIVLRTAIAGILLLPSLAGAVDMRENPANIRALVVDAEIDTGRFWTGATIGAEIAETLEDALKRADDGETVERSAVSASSSLKDGTVIVRFRVDESGETTGIEVASTTHPVVAESMKDALVAWQEEVRVLKDR